VRFLVGAHEPDHRRQVEPNERDPGMTLKAQLAQKLLYSFLPGGVGGHQRHDEAGCALGKFIIVAHLRARGKTTGV